MFNFCSPNCTCLIVMTTISLTLHSITRLTHHIVGIALLVGLVVLWLMCSPIRVFPLVGWGTAGYGMAECVVLWSNTLQHCRTSSVWDRYYYILPPLSYRTNSYCQRPTGCTGQAEMPLCSSRTATCKVVPGSILCYFLLCSLMLLCK
jgi:hypothetical protein